MADEHQRRQLAAERQWSYKHNKYHFGPGELCVLRYSIAGTCFATVLDMRVDDPSSGVQGKVRLRVAVPKEELRHRRDDREQLLHTKPQMCASFPPSVLQGNLDLLHGRPSDQEAVIDLPLQFAESQLRPIMEVSKRLKLDEFPGMEKFVGLREPKAIAVGWPERSDGSPQAWSVGAWHLGAKSPQEAEAMAAERCVQRQRRGMLTSHGLDEQHVSADRMMVDLVWRASWGPVPHIQAPQMAIERRWVLGEWRCEQELQVVAAYLDDVTSQKARRLWDRSTPGDYAEEQQKLLYTLQQLARGPGTNGVPVDQQQAAVGPPSPPGVQRPRFEEKQMVEILHVPLAPALRGAVAVVKQVGPQRLRLLVPQYPGTQQHEVSLKVQHLRLLDQDVAMEKYHQRKGELERIMQATAQAAQASAGALATMGAPEPEEAPETEAMDASPPSRGGKKELRPGAAPFVSAGNQRRRQPGGEDSPPQTGSFFTRLGGEDSGQAKDAFSQMARRQKEETAERQRQKAENPEGDDGGVTDSDKMKSAELQQEWLQVIAEQKRKTAKRKAEGVTYSQMAGMLQPLLKPGADCGRKPFAAGRGRPQLPPPAT